MESCKPRRPKPVMYHMAELSRGLGTLSIDCTIEMLNYGEARGLHSFWRGGEE